MSDSLTRSLEKNDRLPWCWPSPGPPAECFDPGPSRSAPPVCGAACSGARPQDCSQQARDQTMRRLLCPLAPLPGDSVPNKESRSSPATQQFVRSLSARVTSSVERFVTIVTLEHALVPVLTIRPARTLSLRPDGRRPPCA